MSLAKQNFISRNICLSCNALSVYAQLCQNKQQELGFQDVVNTNKIKFEPYLDLVDQHFLNSTRNQLTIKDQYCQKKKKDETPRAEYPNENNPEDIETEQNVSNSLFYTTNITRWWSHRQYEFLKFKAKEVISVVHTWAKGYIKNNGQNDEPTHIFFSGIGVTGKSPLVKNIYNAISITLLYHIKELEKPRVLLLRLQ